MAARKAWGRTGESTALAHIVRGDNDKTTLSRDKQARYTADSVIAGVVSSYPCRVEAAHRAKDNDTLIPTDSAWPTRREVTH